MSKKNPYFIVELENGKLVKKSPPLTSRKAVTEWCKDNSISLHIVGANSALTVAASYAYYEVSQSFFDNYNNQ